jgi:hypothetical protein
MSGHHPRHGAPRRGSAHPAIQAATAVSILLDVAACASTTTPGTSAPAVAAISVDLLS